MAKGFLGKAAFVSSPFSLVIPALLAASLCARLERSLARSSIAYRVANPTHHAAS